MKDLIVKQDDEKDCGAACLLSLIKYYGGYVPIEIIKYDTLTSSRGTNFYNLKLAANSYGFDVVGLKNYKNNQPCIAQVSENNIYHFIVIYENQKDVLVCMDPSIGIRKINKDYFNKIFTGNVLKLTPIGKLPKYRKRNHLISFYFNFLKKHLIYEFLLTIMILIIIISSLLTTYLIRTFSYDSNTLYFLCIIVFIRVLFQLFSSFLSCKLKNKFNTKLLKNYLNKIFFLPYKYLYLKSSGDIINRVNDTSSLARFFGEEIPNIFINVLFFISSVIILIILNPKITIILIILFIISLFLNNDFIKKLLSRYINKVNSENNQSNRINEYITKIMTINYLNKSKHYFERISKLIDENIQSNYRLDINLNMYNFFLEIYNSISLIVIIIFSGNSGFINLFTYLFFYEYYKNSTNYFLNILMLNKYIKDIINRLNSIYYLNEKNKSNLKFTNGDIEFKGVNYKISINKVINNFSFRIKKGDKINIIGKNGSGKSTILNILFGNIDDYTGNIHIGKNNLKDIDKEDLRKNISFINQDSSLFENTIINNILIDNDYDKERFNRIDKILDLEKIIKSKELGYNTLIKNNLSGGEKQKVILARSLYKDASMYIFDEAFSQINIKERKRIINLINDYYKDKTIIYVNHFLDDIKYDKIMKM